METLLCFFFFCYSKLYCNTIFKNCRELRTVIARGEASASQLGTVLPPREHLAVSGDSLGCRNRMGRNGTSVSLLGQGPLTAKNPWAQNVSTAELSGNPVPVAGRLSPLTAKSNKCVHFLRYWVSR